MRRAARNLAAPAPLLQVPILLIQVTEGSIMIRFSRMTLLASLGVLAAGSALAQHKPTFESLDKNGDGKISLNEASSDDALFVAFKQLDTNKDGELTREEFARYK